MSNLHDQDRLLNGVLRDVIFAAEDIGERRYTAATGAKDLEGIALDEHRLRLAEDYAAVVNFLNFTRERSRELKKRIDRDVSAYDAVND